MPAAGKPSSGQTSGRFFVPAKVGAREGEVVSLRTEDGQELRWPAGQLPGALRAGDEVRLAVVTPEAAEADRQELARAVLNEMLAAGS